LHFINNKIRYLWYSSVGRFYVFLKSREIFSTLQIFCTQGNGTFFCGLMPKTEIKAYRMHEEVP